MKIRIKMIITVAVFFISTFIHAQVGIYTKDIRGIYHIDAGKDNTATITPSQQANDIVVDTNGNMGVGTIQPTARLHLKSNSSYGAIKIKDGSEAKGRILQGTASGDTFWATLKGAGGQKIVFFRTAVSFTNNMAIKIPMNETNYEIQVSADGSYSMILRWLPFLRTSINGSKLVNIKYELKRRRQGVAIDVVCQTVNTQAYIGSNQFTSQYTNLIANNILKGDYLYITVTFNGASGDYLYIDRTWAGSVRSQQAFDSQAVIFYQL